MSLHLGIEVGESSLSEFDPITEEPQGYRAGGTFPSDSTVKGLGESRGERVRLSRNETVGGLFLTLSLEDVTELGVCQHCGWDPYPLPYLEEGRTRSHG